MTYRIEITPTALGALDAITDSRIRRAVVARIDALSNEPDKQGKALHRELRGFLSVRAAAQRYRVLYGVDKEEQMVVVYLVGIRKEGSRRDVYKLARRLVQRGFV